MCVYVCVCAHGAPSRTYHENFDFTLIFRASKIDMDDDAAATQGYKELQQAIQL